MKLIIFLTLSINILFSNETKAVKTSELELFLFKVGFESLLNDVEITKDKSNLNEIELEKLNSKIEIIMNEVYKEKRVLISDEKINITNSNLEKVLISLKKEVSFLKEELNKLIETKNVRNNKSMELDKNTSTVNLKYKVVVLMQMLG